MENILKEINLEIKRIAQSEEIDTQRLTELINIRDRLKGYNTTSISQVQGFNMPVQPTPVLGNMRQHQGNSVYDSIVDIANVYLKNQTKQLNDKNNINIHDLMFYYKFITELGYRVDDEKTFKIKEDIEQLIMKELENIINREKNIEKDKILDTTSEIKNTSEAQL